MKKLLIFIFLLICLFNFSCTNPTSSPQTSTYKILVSRFESQNNRNLYIRNLDGSEEICLSSNLKYSFNGKFTPDGTKIFFFSSDSNVISRVKFIIVDQDGNNRDCLLETSGVHLHNFSLSNTDMVYVKVMDDRAQIYRLDFETKTEINFSPYPYLDFYPEYSPDRQKIAFVRCYNDTNSIYIMNKEGGELTRILYYYSENSSRMTNVRFTADGRKIIFYFKGELFRIDIDGKNLIQLTESEGPIDGRNLTVSPIGYEIVYNEWESEEFIAHTYIQNIFFGTRLELFDLSGPSWDYIFTPNGRNVFFSTNDGIFMVDVDGNFVRQISFNEHAFDLYEYK